MLTFALAYGFRNIQGVMTKMRRGKCAYDFVEVRAPAPWAVGRGPWAVGRGPWGEGGGRGGEVGGQRGW